MTAKPYKSDKENNTSHVSEPMAAYEKTIDKMSIKLEDNNLKLEATKAELARAILSINSEQLLTKVINRLFGLLEIKMPYPKAKEISETDQELKLDEDLHKLSGIWANDPSADKIYEAIQNGRQSGVTRHIISFDE